MAVDQCRVLRWNVSTLPALCDHRSLSVHRHVAKTGDIKEFTITEESGIAKGIRRIIGVTGEKAREAHQRCTDMQKRLDELKRLPDMKSQENAFKFFNLVRVLAASYLHLPTVICRI